MSNEKPLRLLDRLAALLHDKPETREELVNVLRDAHTRNLIDSDALSIAEGALAVRELTARDVMIPRSSMDVIEVDDPLSDSIGKAVDTRHSRFPVVGDNRDDVIGILLAKDFLQYFLNPEDFDLRAMLRPSVFVPESKPLNVLLREFRVNRNHMAIVVDEYGGVAGLVTIEDVLEQIVGDIADEHDFDHEEENIIAESAAGHYRVKASTSIEDFNTYFSTHYGSEDFDTIGGLVTNAFGRVPKRNESVRLEEHQFTIARADSRRVVTLTVHKAGTKA
jgi:magnesium and cobalt transporter